VYKSKHNSIRNHMQLHTDERAELVKTDLAAPPTTATSVSWAVDTDGDWSVTSNWSNNKLPTASNSVTLSSPHAHTVTHSIGTDAINSLTSTTDTLAMTGGSLSITTNSAIGGGLAQTGGVLSFKGGASTVSSLTLNDTGEITLAKTATLTATGSVTMGLGITVRFQDQGLLLPTGQRHCRWR